MLRPGQRIDHQSAASFGDALQPYLDKCRAGTGSLVLDLAETEYMSSVGLRVLVVAARQVKPEGGRIVVCGLQPALREIFEISRIHLIFDIFGTADEAVAALAA